MKALQTKTFRRFARKTLRVVGNMPLPMIAKVTAKKAAHRAKAGETFSAAIVRQLLVKRETLRAVPNIERIKVEKQDAPALQLPPSMPKNAAAKIASYSDLRNTTPGGQIIIQLNPDYCFRNDDSSYVWKTAYANNVKEAIAIMRTVEAV